MGRRTSHTASLSLSVHIWNVGQHPPFKAGLLRIKRGESPGGVHSFNRNELLGSFWGEGSLGRSFNQDEDQARRPARSTRDTETTGPSEDTGQKGESQVTAVVHKDRHHDIKVNREGKNAQC